MARYLAHIAEDGREQTILDHLTGTAAQAQTFARPFDTAEQAALAGLAHDLGKYTAAFQKRLHGDTASVDHATAGAYACFRRRQLPAAFAVMGHHGGLPDGGGKGDSSESSTFFGRIRKAAQSGVPTPDPVWEQQISLPSPPIPAWADHPLDGMFFTRMLYSCLVDADFLDTETFMRGQCRPTGDTASMDELWARLCTYVSGWSPPEGELNAQRCAVLERCMAEGEARQPGLFTLTVPTGGGKTVSSLAFALAHARAHGLRRVIYVIPYTSIIEQTAAIFRDILGAENVLEHHANVDRDTAAQGELAPHDVRLLQATENWDAPVIVTTAVQFFESLFACKPSRCRKLHSIAGSVVIFDEAQMLPLPYLRPCVWAIAQLVAHYRVSAVLCTATQPALHPLFAEFLPGQTAIELCPDGLLTESVFHRVTFRRAGKLSWDALAAQLNAHKQVLCIVNARQSARTVFSKLDGEGCFHLSTLMYPAHRQAQLAEIRDRLDRGLPCRVVSTSLIEAGVDVDFPAVYREENGLDAILQAAGRCNREGKNDPNASIVTIFQGEDAPPARFGTQIGVGRKVLDRQADPASRQAIYDYFHELLTLVGKTAQDPKSILKTIEQGFFPFRTVAEQFRLIEQETRTVYIPLGEGAALVERLQRGERSRALFRRLGRYGVSVYADHFHALDRAGALTLLEDGGAILTDLGLYHASTGLSTPLDGQAHLL
ncbi:MAG: CRISPR-associated endonuclease Cas3'' [Eubacteriales bacterium]|nr:CRISPR-associated endonuclease Cas3'' [Eubacteriales bacterium]